MEATLTFIIKYLNGQEVLVKQGTSRFNLGKERGGAPVGKTCDQEISTG